MKLKDFKDYLESKGLNFIIHKLNINSQIPKSDEHPCFICSYRRREFLFRIALGHHRDDVIVTFMMNLLFHGEVATSVPKQTFFGGKMEIIRPLYFLWEDWIKYFIGDRNLPTFSSNCPYKGKSKRDELRGFIESYPHSKKNLYKSLFYINKDYLP